MSFSIGGLASGIDTAALVSSLMQAERIPQQKLQAQQRAAVAQVNTWNDLRTKMQAIQTAADALATPAKALGSVATSSDEKSVRATATADAAPGQYSVTVGAIARAQQQTKRDLGPLSMTVGAGRSYVVAGSLTLDLSAAPAGVQKVEVTRPSAAAAVYGTPKATLSATDLTVAVDGAPAVALGPLQGSYADTRDADGRVVRTAAQALVDDVNTRLTDAGLGGSVRASLVGGRLQLATTAEGSAKKLQLGGGAAAALELSTAEARGQSALVTVNGKSQEVEPRATTGLVALGTSGVSLEVGPTLRAGGTTANVVVTTEATTLGELQGMLNTTGSPVSAALVAQADGQNTMVLSSTATGTAGRLTVTAGTPVLDGFAQTTAAEDAKVTINGVDVVRSSNKLTDILPGLSLDLLAVQADGAARTITVSRDSAGTSDKAKALVEAMNSFISKVAVDTRYDVKSRTGGPLVGDSAARSLSGTLFQKASGVVGTPTLRALSQLGIETTRDGKFQLKPEVLTKALASDPDAVGKVLSEFASSVAAFAKSATETGGLMTGRRDGAQADADARQKQADAMETRLAAVEKRYKTTYATLETALARLKSQGGALNAALSGFSGGSGGS